MMPTVDSSIQNRDHFVEKTVLRWRILRNGAHWKRDVVQQWTIIGTSMEIMNSKFSQKPIGLVRFKLHKTNPGSLHNTTRRVLFYCRVVGLLPLLGLNSHTSIQLRYTLRSPYTICYGISFFGQMLMLFAAWNDIFHKGFTLDTLTHLMYYMVNFLLFMTLAKTCQSWPFIIRTVEKMENKLPPFRKSYNITIIVVIVLIMAAGAVEEILYVIYTYNIAYACDPYNVANNYFKASNSWIFDYIIITLWRGIIVEFFHIQTSFINTSVDWLMILISLYLTEHFLVHNERLKKAVQQKHFSCANFRAEYLKIVNITKIINFRFGIFLMTSIGSNLYGICVQLFYALNHGQQIIVCDLKDSAELKSPLAVNHFTYFAFSFSYLIIRALLIIHLAARIQSNALVPVHILYELPSSKYSQEVEKYMSQVKSFKIVLSGLDFFYVTRNMILSVLGTIVTYELVLFQFNNRQ